jgi:DNA-directed RNA polymerase sigma subunit (sigma70/sigma32)
METDLALASLAVADPAPPVLEAMIAREDRAIMARAFDSLVAASPVKALVLIRRYGLGGRDAQTLEQIAHDLGTSRGNIRRIEMRALAALIDLAHEHQS